MPGRTRTAAAIARLTMLLLTVAASTPLGAQDARVADMLLVSGTRVRFELRAGGGRQVGRTVALRGDSLTVERAGQTVTLPLADIKSLDRSLGRRRSFARSAAMGTLLGTGVGAIVGAVSYSPCSTTESFGCFLEPKNRGESALQGGLIGAVAGVVVGGVVGLVPRERWSRVPLVRVGASMAPRAGGLYLAASTTF